MSRVMSYLRGVYDGCSDMPIFSVQSELSRLLDERMGLIVQGYENVLNSSNLTMREVNLIGSQPRLVGEYHQDKLILKGYNPFEQAFFLKQSLSSASYLKTHTFYFATQEDERIFVRVNKPAKKSLSLMHVVFGNGKWAPKYESWAVNDPLSDPSQAKYVEMLFGLENSRQIKICAASIIKHAIFLENLIDHEWRYGMEYACVEAKKQSANTKEKLASAGKNLTGIVEYFSDASDPGAKDTMMNPSLFKYEEVFPDADEYNDDISLCVSPSDLIQGCLEFYENRSIAQIDEALEKLFITTLGRVKNPTLQGYLKQRVHLLSQ